MINNVLEIMQTLYTLQSPDDILSVGMQRATRRFEHIFKHLPGFDAFVGIECFTGKIPQWIRALCALTSIGASDSPVAATTVVLSGVHFVMLAVLFFLVHDLMYLVNFSVVYVHWAPSIFVSGAEEVKLLVG